MTETVDFGKTLTTRMFARILMVTAEHLENSAVLANYSKIKVQRWSKAIIESSSWM